MIPFKQPIDIRFCDLDGLGHVNNAVYLSYFEALRLNYGFTLFGSKQLEAIPFILGEITVRYLKPVFFGDQIIGSAWVSRIGSKSFTLEYAIHRGDELVTKGSSELVWFDYANNKTIEIPDSFRQRVAALQGNNSI